MRQWCLTKDALRSLVQAYLHCRHSAGLLQRYSLLEGTADIAIKHLQSLQNTAACLVSGKIFRDYYHCSTQPPLASGVAQTVSKCTVLSLSIWTLCTGKNFRGRPWLPASTGYPMPKVQMTMRQRSFAFYGSVWDSLQSSVACHWTGSNGNWKRIILNSNEHHSWRFYNIKPYKYKCDHLV